MESAPVTFNLSLTKYSVKILNKEITEKAIHFLTSIPSRKFNSGLSTIYDIKDLTIETLSDGRRKYFLPFKLVVSPNIQQERIYNLFDSCFNNMYKEAEKIKWELDAENNPDMPSLQNINKRIDAQIIRNRVNVSLPELTEEVIEKYFSRLYSRESHIRIVYDSIKQAVNTKFVERNHVLLHGDKPGCAKTEIFLAFESWLGSDFIRNIDATTMTKAGLERELLKMSTENTLPPIIKFEEIEKVQEPKNINCLLQVMDSRGRIQRMNARDGDTYGECKVIVWATCNDSELLRKFAGGAIWSRFSLKLKCNRPNKYTMRKILLRTCNEVAAEGGYCGDTRHVNLIVDFLYGKDIKDKDGKTVQISGLKDTKGFEEDYNDPRLANALLSGGDRILNEDIGGFLDDFKKVCE